MKRAVFLALGLTLVLPLSSSTITKAQTTDTALTNPISTQQTSTDVKQYKSFEEDIKSNTYSIDEKNYRVLDINDFASKHNIPLTNNGKSIKKIEIEYVPAAVSESEYFNPSNTSIIQPQGILTSIYAVTDHGPGWYNESDDLYAHIVVPGPDTFVISKTDSFYATRNGEFGITDSGVSAKVGFTIGSTYSVTFTSNTPVPKGQTLTVDAYTTYTKKECWVQENVGLQYIGTIWAYKPTGATFIKTWY